MWPSTAAEPSLETYVNVCTQHASGLVWAGKAVWFCEASNVSLWPGFLNNYWKVNIQKTGTGTTQMLICLSHTLQASGGHCDFLRPNCHNPSNAVAGFLCCGQVNGSRHCALFQPPLYFICFGPMSQALKPYNTQTISCWTQEYVMFVCAHPCAQIKVRGKIKTQLSKNVFCICVQEKWRRF